MRNLASLFEVRKLSTLSIVALFIVLALKGELDPNFTENIILTVVAYYFGKSTALDQPKK